MAITNYWSTAPSLTTTTQMRPGEPGATLPAPTALSLTQFMNWSLADQIAYVEAKGTGTTPKSVSIGPTGSAIAVSYTSPGGPLTFSTPSQLPAPELVSADDFLVWTRESQIAYIEAKGTGSPKAVYLGAAAPNGTKAEIVANGALQLRVGSSTGEAFTVQNPGRAALASEMALAPTALDANIFLSWTAEDRQAYVLAKATGTPPSVTIGSGTLKIHAAPTSDVSVAAGVIQRTSGDYEPIPYFELSGSANGTPSSVIATSAEWLFPSLDGEESKLPVEERPAQFYFDVTASGVTDAEKTAFLADFAKWHSAYQLEYIKAHGTNVTVGSVQVKKLDVVVGTPAARLTAIVSPDDPTKHFIVQSLDKAAIARMTKAEQEAIVATGSAFTDIAASLGLSTATADNLSAATNKTNGGTILSGAPTPPFTVSEYVGELIYDVYHTTAPNKGGSTLPTAATDAFNTQLEILREQIANSAIVSPADIKKKVDELRDRFNRLFAFWNVKEETGHSKAMGNPDTNITVYTDVISQKGDLTGINRGYAVFLAQEQRIAELAEGRMQLVRAGGIFNGKSLDVPYLVYKFQSLYNLSLEAQVVAETEQVNQQNDMLKTYAAIQDIVNRTLANFPKADDTKRGVLGKGVDDTPSLTADEMKLLSMFEDNLGGGQKHPMEVLNSINRPLYNFFNSDTGNNENFDLNQFTHTQWSTYGTRLSETVTLINQNSQIQMNDINSLDKERNRHFELANNALSKMADIIGNIARAGG